MMKKTLLLAFLAISYIMSFGQTNANFSPDFTAISLEKDTFNLVDFWNQNPNKYVALEFFFTESEYCQEISPMIDSAYNFFGNNEHDIYFLSINIGNDSAQCQNYINEFSLQHGVVSGTQGNGNEITEAYQIQSFPTVILMALDTITTYITKDTIINEDTSTIYLDTLYRNISIQDIWPITSTQDIIDSILTADPAIYHNQNYSNIGILKPENSFTPLSVYPNPADEMIKVDVSDYHSEIHYQIFDLSGRMILNKQLSTFNSKEIEINISNLNEGIYLLKLSDDEKSASQKISIQ